MHTVCVFCMCNMLHTVHKFYFAQKKQKNKLFTHLAKQEKKIHLVKRAREEQKKEKKMARIRQSHIN